MYVMLGLIKLEHKTEQALLSKANRAVKDSRGEAYQTKYLLLARTYIARLREIVAPGDTCSNSASLKT